uniref:Uncharacterized protein n=1 Tax=Sus scrofa TaxID=9823 RepID=A0A4X1W921_PIG
MLGDKPAWFLPHREGRGDGRWEMVPAPSLGASGDYGRRRSPAWGEQQGSVSQGVGAQTTRRALSSPAWPPLWPTAAAAPHTMPQLRSQEPPWTLGLIFQAPFCPLSYPRPSDTHSDPDTFGGQKDTGPHFWPSEFRGHVARLLPTQIRVKAFPHPHPCPGSRVASREAWGRSRP